MENEDASATGKPEDKNGGGDKKESPAEEAAKANDSEQLADKKESAEDTEKKPEDTSEKKSDKNPGKDPESDGLPPVSRKGGRAKRALFFLVALAIFTAAVLGGIYLKSGPQSHMGTEGLESGENDPLYVETITIESSDTYESKRVYSGMIKAKRSLDLSFQASGRVDTILPETGDRVEEGVELAYFDNTDLENTREELDEKRVDTQDDLDDLLDDGIPKTNERVKGMQTAIDDLQKKIDEIDDAIDSRTLTAPFEGIIAMKHVTEGAVVSPSVPVLRIMQEDNLEAWIAVPVSAVSQLKEDTDYELIVGEKTYKAQIDTILPEVDSRTRTRTVVFAFSEKDSGEVAAGGSVELILKEKVSSDGFWLPIKAMTREVRGLWSVYLVNADENGKETISRAYLEVIYLEGERAWVRGTLRDGDQVVIGDGDRIVADGILRIVPGQHVTTSRKPAEAKDEQGQEDAVEDRGEKEAGDKSGTKKEDSDP